jgi:uncharacterized protein (DUF983 family)
MTGWQATETTDTPLAPRDWKQAMKRGLMCRCPACGEGRIFERFLKVKPACDNCGERFDGHRADDMPPYITMMIVGHVIVALNLFFERATEWPMAWHMMLWPSLTVGMTLLIMQPIKGALIAYQWALRMHGFDPAGDYHAAPRPTR